MSWTAPRTFLVSDVLGASDMNTWVSNNDAYLLQRNYVVAALQSSGADYALSTASAWTSVDATNLAIVFTPQSTRVRVDLSFTVDPITLSGASDLYMDVFNGTVRAGLATGGLWRNTQGASGAQLFHVGFFGIFTGLTANTSYTFTLQYFKVSGNQISIKRAGYPILFMATEF